MQNELNCDALLNNPALVTPPPEPVPPPPRKPVFKKKIIFPPRFPLVPLETYNSWVSHRKEILATKHYVDDNPPELFPELYLKPRRLDFYATQIEENMLVNKELLKKINLIQRTGGYVDCWLKWSPGEKYNKLLCIQRQRAMNAIQKNNIYLYQRLLTARSDMLLTKEMDEEWKETKKKLILGASLPFILFKTEKIERGFKDPNFNRPPGVYRSKVAMEIWVDSGAKIGRVFIELFNEVVPQTCALFLTLVNGDGFGHGYKGTSIFRIVPGLYCRVGDVTKNNGFGCYKEEGQTEPIAAENYDLKHSVPGVLSMAVTNSNEVCGQFNIIFKPLPQLNGKNVVFGRIVAGPAEVLERISALGLPLGSPSNNVIIRYCGVFNSRGKYTEGAPNTIKFPQQGKKKKP